MYLYFSHLVVGKAIPNTKTKTKFTVDKINSYNLLKNSQLMQAFKTQKQISSFWSHV